MEAKNTSSNDTWTKLLFAQLNRALELGRFMHAMVIDYDQMTLQSTILRNRNGSIRLFSGVFMTSMRSSAAPFSLGFYGADWSCVSQMSLVTHRGTRPSVLAYLSIIDYLCERGELNNDLQRYIESVGKQGKNVEKAAAAEGYAEFKLRAAKDLPYDLSLEVLNDIAHGTKAA